MIFRTAALCALLLAFGSGCSTPRVIEKPIPVEVPGPVERVPVPASLLEQREPVDLPQDPPTYGEIWRMWVEDRANLRIVNNQLQSIKDL